MGRFIGRTALPTILVSFLWMTATQAEERYSLEKTADGAIRLDRKTGAISYCKDINGGIACSMAADERAAWRKETQDMALRIDELEKRIAQLETAKGNARPNTEKPAQKPPAELSGKEERQLDKAMRVTENVMRRFMTMMKDLKKDIQSN